MSGRRKKTASIEEGVCCFIPKGAGVEEEGDPQNFPNKQFLSSKLK